MGVLANVLGALSGLGLSLIRILTPPSTGSPSAGRSSSRSPGWPDRGIRPGGGPSCRLLPRLAGVPRPHRRGAGELREYRRQLPRGVAHHPGSHSGREDGGDESDSQSLPTPASSAIPPVAAPWSPRGPAASGGGERAPRRPRRGHRRPPGVGWRSKRAWGATALRWSHRPPFFAAGVRPRVTRDPTRGGLATAAPWSSPGLGDGDAGTPARRGRSGPQGPPPGSAGRIPRLGRPET